MAVDEAERRPGRSCLLGSKPTARGDAELTVAASKRFRKRYVIIPYRMAKNEQDLTLPATRRIVADGTVRG